MAGLTWY